MYTRTGVVIGTHVYIFGGRSHNNMLRKLITNAKGSFVWSKIHIEDQTKVPSPRTNHCAWEHGEKMWVFGGHGPSPVDYLNNHGDYRPLLPHFSSSQTNNQLFSYDPTTVTWINIRCSGEVPSPQHEASTAKIHDTVWLYGGTTEFCFHSNELYELNMHSFAWTKIEATCQKPKETSMASLTPISASHLLLYGGNQHMNTKPWIYNVQTHAWSRHPTAKRHCRWNHTGITGLNSSVIILGGEVALAKKKTKKTILSVILEPKSLKKLAIQMIYKHRSELPWENLPKSLTCNIMITE